MGYIHLLEEAIQFRELALEVIFQVYIVQGFFFVFFLIMGIIILSRGLNRINLTFSNFYFSIATAFFLNFLFVPLANDFLMNILYFLTLFFLYLGSFFLVLFTILVKDPKKLSLRKELLLLAFYWALLIGMVFIPKGLTFNESTDFHPVYSDFFILYLMLLLTICLIPTLTYSLQIYNKLKNQELRLRWRSFILGIIGYYIFAYGTLIIYKITLGVIVFVWSFITIILIIFSSYAIYHGFIRRLN